jgi:hypothetical protein
MPDDELAARQQPTEGEGELFSVEVRRSITVSVQVRAASGEAAAEIVNRSGYELPPRDEWSGEKDWQYTVIDASGDVVYEQYR